MKEELDILNHHRLAAEKAYDYAEQQKRFWENESYKKWKIAVELGDQWYALKEQLDNQPK
jgi:hypothetical protein